MRRFSTALLAVTLLAAAATAQTTASKPASTAPATLPANYPPPGLKLQRVEQSNTGQSLGTSVADEITYDNTLINTKGLAALGFPPVKISVSPGNATDFYRGTAPTKDGGQVAWQWGVLQFPRPNTPPQKFHASVTVTAKDGKQTLWVLTQAD